MRKMTKGQIIGLILLPVMILAAMFGVEAICQRELLTLASEEQGSHVIALTSCTLEDPEAEAYEDEYEEEVEEEVDPDAPLYLYSASARLTIPYEGYIHDLTLTGEVASSQKYSVVVTLAEGGRKTIPAVYNAPLAQDTIPVRERVKAITVSFPNGDGSISAIEVHNEFVLNPSRMLLCAVLTACLWALTYFRRFMGKKPEYAFLAVMLAVGFFLSVGLPTNAHLSYDDQIHAGRIFALSWGPNSRTTAGANLIATMSWGYNEEDTISHEMDTLRDERALVAQMDTLAASDEPISEEKLHWQFFDTGYITQVAGVAAARALGLPFHMQLITARVCNMLTYAALCFFAIRTLKRFKYLMAAVALMPTPVFLAANLSYDPTGAGLCFLGIALVMDAIMDKYTLLTWKRALGILVCFAVGALTKVVYMPLLLLALLLPRTKFESRAQHAWFKTAAVVICLVGILAMVANVAGDSSIIQDDRGNGADSEAQMAFLLSQPLTYLGYFFTYLWRHFTTYFFTACRTTWAYLGSAGETLSTLSLAVLLFTVFTDGDAPELRRSLGWKTRVGMLLIAGIITGMVFTTLYVAFSPVGVMDFSGVQARYLIPILPICYMILSPNGIQNRMSKTGWTWTFSVLNLAILAALCWEKVCQQYFL